MEHESKSHVPDSQSQKQYFNGNGHPGYHNHGSEPQQYQYGTYQQPQAYHHSGYQHQNLDPVDGKYPGNINNEFQDRLQQPDSNKNLPGYQQWY
ncbi:hypothetical protein DSO57_1031242 [Entomophthora muscae]|uniref:Uncharacterized protein n=1 Tax=Entomophthora muscae TaxID=34485 RepID=A0ACC2T0K5_9FUNG|nr:hypothetical protein DSO57_1031242 [Entomophthora muscae]